MKVEGGGGLFVVEVRQRAAQQGRGKQAVVAAARHGNSHRSVAKGPRGEWKLSHGPALRVVQKGSPRGALNTVTRPSRKDARVVRKSDFGERFEAPMIERLHRELRSPEAEDRLAAQVLQRVASVAHLRDERVALHRVDSAVLVRVTPHLMAASGDLPDELGA